MSVQTTEPLVFRVSGVPQPQGSMRALFHRQAHKVVMMSDNPNLNDWRELVAIKARERWRGRQPVVGAVQLQLQFWLPRPRGHFGKLQTVLLAKAPHDMTKHPDLDKLVRGVCDALGIARIFKNDAQINAIDARKDYADDEADVGAQIVVMFE